MSKDIKQFLEEELKKEEIATMKEVAEDIDVQGLTAPDEMEKALFAQIDAYEKSLIKEEYAEVSRLTQEEKELIRLGTEYRRKKRYTKYWVFAAVLVLALAIGTTSLGGPKKIVRTVVEKVMGNRSRVKTNTDDGTVGYEATVSEDEAYQQVKDKWNVEPVRLLYLPEGVGFRKAETTAEIQMMQMFYYDDNDVKIVFQILPGYSAGSFSSGVEEQDSREYKKTVKGVEITIGRYQVESNTERQLASFVYQDVQYFLWVTDTNQSEMEKIVENLSFL